MFQVKIPATYMRGGTSKGVFFRSDVIPSDFKKRDELFLRIIGSPDPYEKHIDGMGGATSSTSKIVVVGPSDRDDCDVDYLFGQVSINTPVIDYSGNCGNLTSAVGPFAIREGFVSAPDNGIAIVRIWQANINKRIVAKVPMKDGQVLELGDFNLDGVTFPAAEIVIDFYDPAADEGMFPTGKMIDVVNVPGLGGFEVTLINAGNPHVFLSAASLGLKGNELPSELNSDKEFLEKAEAIRSFCAVKMGLAKTMEEATQMRPHTPKLAFFSHPQSYTCPSGNTVHEEDIDLTARILSMGKVHHAMTGTGGIAIAVAAEIKETLVCQTSVKKDKNRQLRIGHSSGVMAVGATLVKSENEWKVEKVSMGRSARRIMEGWVLA